jgi:hypothetical protein
MNAGNRKAVSVHYPVVQVPLREGGFVEVRELSWPEATELFSRLKEQFLASFDEQGNLVLDARKVVDGITTNMELMPWLAMKATGKDPAWLKTLSIGEVMAISEEAAVLNVGVFVQRLKNAGGRLRTLATAAQPQVSQEAPNG